MSFVISSRYFRRRCESGTGIQMPRPHLKEASRKQAATSYRMQHPTRTANRDHLQYSAITRPTATVPPNTLLSTGTLATSNNEPTTISLISTPLPINRNASYSITVDRFPHLNPEVSIIELPISTSERTEEHPGNQGNDDVVYLYTVDSRPTQSLAEEVDLTQESQENSSGNVQVIELENLSVTTAKAENTGPGKTTVTKKNRKRKLEGYGAMKKRKTIDDAQPVCSLCTIHNESLTEMAENMFLGSCGHLFCSPCTRKIKVNNCETCGKKINGLRKLFF